MRLKKSARESASRLDVLDAQMDAYLHWRRQCRAVAASYRTWSSASRSECGAAFRDYMAALALEEDAARACRLVVDWPHIAEPVTIGGRAIGSCQMT